MKIVFMGTPDFSLPSLKKLYKDSEIDVVGVVTQPDRPRGRGQKLKPSSVKKLALELGIKEIMQPENVNQPQFLDKLRGLNMDAVVVVAFGQKLGSELLNLPRYGCINLHASLLPEYRGSSPIHKAIIEGKEKTGVTTMFMDEGWDTGDIIYQKEIIIKRSDTAGSLHDRLAGVGADLLVKTLHDIEAGKAPRNKQDDNEATYAYKIDKELGKIDWKKSSEEIYNLVRGVNPWPGAYTKYEDQLLKIWQVEITNKDLPDGEPGEVIAADEENGLVVSTGEGLLEIKKLQPAGKKRMIGREYLRGYEINPGDRLI